MEIVKKSKKKTKYLNIGGHQIKVDLGNGNKIEAWDWEQQ